MRISPTEASLQACGNGSTTTEIGKRLVQVYRNSDHSSLHHNHRLVFKISRYRFQTYRKPWVDMYLSVQLRASKSEDRSSGNNCTLSPRGILSLYVLAIHCIGVADESVYAHYARSTPGHWRRACARNNQSSVPHFPPSLSALERLH